MPGIVLPAVESRFDGALKAYSKIQWLNYNSPCYIAGKTLAFLKKLGLKVVTTSVSSPQGNEIVESFIKAMERECISWMVKGGREYGVTEPGHRV
jgi:putative transposase